MGRKDKSQGHVLSRVYWTVEQFNLFVDLCIQGTTSGKRNGGGWGDVGYQWLINELNAAGVIFTKQQLKHKWDWMRGQWKMWKDLIGEETNLVWDPVKNTIVASDEWWSKKIQENPEVEKLREKGIGKELLSKYDCLFMNAIATGEYAHAVSSRVLPNDLYKTDTIQLVEKSGDSEHRLSYSSDKNKGLDGDVSSAQSTQAAPRSLGLDRMGVTDIQSRGRKQKRSDSSSSQAKKSRGKKQLTGVAQVSESVRDFRETMVHCMAEKTSILKAALANRPTFGERPGYSVPDVMEDLLSLEGMEEGSDFHLFCTFLLEHKSKREVYANLKAPASKVKWLHYQHSLFRDGLWRPGGQ